jgi:hypothetical protein
MASAFYFLVSCGFAEVTGKFWKSLVWPYYAGELLAQEAIKRGVVA